MKIIAIIPARGGSKGIPKKNIYPLCGKPLISYMIQHAQEANYFDRMFVSTDDDDIERISIQHGAEIIRRPGVLSKDGSYVEGTIFHAIRTLIDDQYEPDIAIMLNCTSPLIYPMDIIDCGNLIFDKGADSAFTATPDCGVYWQNRNEEAFLLLQKTSNPRTLRQNIINLYKEAGGVFAMRVKGFLEHKCLFFGKVMMHVIPNNRAIDINTIDDLKYAEFLLNERNIKN